MKAYQLHGINDLRFVETDKPKLKKGYVLLEVKAAGICGSDIPRIFETGTYHFPTVPGHEFAGIVREVFDKEDERFIGKRVGVFPLIPCKECDSCLQENYETCSHYNYLGSRTDGGFAEYVLVPTWNLIELPNEVSFEEAAMLEPIAVSLHAMKQIDWSNRESAVIYGVGPIGMMAAQWLRSFGIKQILLVGNKPEQIKLANAIGFTDVCNCKEQDALQWIKEQTGGNGVDVAVEGVGTSECLTQCLESVKAKGSILTLANPKGDMNLDKQAYWKILRKQLTVCGTWNSRFGTSTDDNWKEAVAALSSNQISAAPLITHKLSFEELPTGLAIMKDKKEFYCKVMITR